MRGPPAALKINGPFCHYETKESSKVYLLYVVIQLQFLVDWVVCVCFEGYPMAK